MQHRRAILAALTSLLASAVLPAGGAATNTAASWGMNEEAGSTVMTDSSSNHLNGSIGSMVKTGVRIDGAVAYQWPFTKPNAPPAKPERLVKVPDSAVLDPGTRDYAVIVRYRTTHGFGNIVQKGQSGATGGYWKLQAPKGILSCLFWGADGSKSVNSGIVLNDGTWHKVTCERTADRVTMTILDADGSSRLRRALGQTGKIANSSPLTIGGKAKCDQVEVTCDYFTGAIDYIRIKSD